MLCESVPDEQNRKIGYFWRKGLTEAAEDTLAELMHASVLVCWPLLQELQGLVSHRNAAHGLALHRRAKLGLLKLLQLSCVHSKHIKVEARETWRILSCAGTGFATAMLVTVMRRYIQWLTFRGLQSNAVLHSCCCIEGCQHSILSSFSVRPSV